MEEKGKLQEELAQEVWVTAADSARAHELALVVEEPKAKLAAALKIIADHYEELAQRDAELAKRDTELAKRDAERKSALVLLENFNPGELARVEEEAHVEAAEQTRTAAAAGLRTPPSLKPSSRRSRGRTCLRSSQASGSISSGRWSWPRRWGPFWP